MVVLGSTIAVYFHRLCLLRWRRRSRRLRRASGRPPPPCQSWNTLIGSRATATISSGGQSSPLLHAMWLRWPHQNWSDVMRILIGVDCIWLGCWEESSSVWSDYAARIAVGISSWGPSQSKWPYRSLQLPALADVTNRIRFMIPSCPTHIHNNPIRLLAISKTSSNATQLCMTVTICPCTSSFHCPLIYDWQSVL